jgi:hypothetical protein
VPIQRRSGEQPAPGAPIGAPGATLERVIPFHFTAADGSRQPEQRESYLDLMRTLYGEFDDLSWLDGGIQVSYHDMADAVFRGLGPALDGVDLVVTVQASPDFRLQSFPGCRLTDLLPGDPFMFGVSEQGVAGPFLALRIAVDRLARGLSRRALVLVMEQSSLPPDAAAIRPAHDVAVAIVLGPDGPVPIGSPGKREGGGAPSPLRLGRPVLTVTSRVGMDTPVAALDGPVDPGSPGDDADVLVVGHNLADIVPGPGVTVIRGAPGHACADVWLALARLLAAGGTPGGRVRVVDQDPVLPYLCSVDLTLPIAAEAALREPELVR